MKILGIDVGGSSTRFCLYDCERKSILEKFNIGVGLNLTSTKSSTQRHVIRNSFESLKNYKLDGIVASVSGGGCYKRVNKFKMLLSNIFNVEPIVMSDVEAVKRILLGDKKGIIVIAGTGTIALSHDGQRVGGWGHLFGDEAGGFSIAVRILRNFFSYKDGISSHDPVYDWLLDYFNLSENEFYRLTSIQNEKNFKSIIASITKAMPLTPLVKFIIEDELEKFTKKIKYLANMTNINQIYTHGGMFKNHYYRKTFTEKLKEFDIHIADIEIEVELAKLFCKLF